MIKYSIASLAFLAGPVQYRLLFSFVLGPFLVIGKLALLAGELSRS